jgi:hypothetical protein
VSRHRGKCVNFSFTRKEILSILIIGGNMPAKAPVKKTTKGLKSPSAHQTKSLKPVKKTVKKPPKKVTLDDLLKSQNEAWVAIRETEESFKKFQDETQKTHKETEKAIKETEKAIKETQINIGGLNRSLGSMVEHILTPGLPQKFKRLGYSFNRIATYKYAEGVYAQIDGMLENGTQAVVVEVKVTLRQGDIDDHLLRMEKIRKYADEHGDKRQFMGAMAATITDETTRNYALKKGLFVIEPSGEDVKVTKPEKEVRVW